MDHQIQDYVDIQTSWSKKSHPVRLDETGLPDHLSHAPDGGVETLQVAHLKNTVIPFGGPDEAIRIFR